MFNAAGKYSPFPKMSFGTSLHQQSLTENSMLCYGPLVSELGGPKVHGAPNTVIGGLCPTPGSAAYVSGVYAYWLLTENYALNADSGTEDFSCSYTLSCLAIPAYPSGLPAQTVTHPSQY